MICERCGTVFCWDEADTAFLGGRPKLFCSKACKKNASKARQALAVRDQHRRQVQLQMCAERPKTGYATREAALLAVTELRPVPPLYPYGCSCGWWHLTKREPEPK